MFLHSYFIVFSSVNLLKTLQFSYMLVLMPKTSVFLEFILFFQVLGFFYKLLENEENYQKVSQDTNTLRASLEVMMQGRVGDG